MVSFATFEAELTRNEPGLVEKGMTSSLPDFDHLMYAAVKRKIFTILKKNLKIKNIFIILKILLI